MTSACVAQFELRAFEMAEAAERVRPQLEDVLTKIKPINLTCLLLDIFMARSVKHAMIGVTRLMEMYDIFWKIPQILLDGFKVLFGWLLRHTIASYKELKAFFINFMSTKSDHTAYTPEEFETQCDTVSESGSFESCLDEMKNQGVQDEIYDQMISTCSVINSFELKKQSSWINDVALYTKEQAVNRYLLWSSIISDKCNFVKEEFNYWIVHLKNNVKVDENIKKISEWAKEHVEDLYTYCAQRAPNPTKIPSGFEYVMNYFTDMFGTLGASVTTIFNHVKDTMTKNPQTIPLIGWVLALVTMIGGGTAIANIDICGEISKTIVKLGNTTRGMQNIQSGLDGLSQAVTNTACQVMGVKAPLSTPKQRVAKRCIDAADKINALVRGIQETPEIMIQSETLFKEVDEAMKEVEELWRELAQSKDSCPMIQSLIFEIKENERNLKTFVRNFVNSLVGKPVPATIYFSGASGVGKSHLSAHIVNLLSKLEGRQLTPYSRNCSDKFWAGYCGQDVVIYDDFNAGAEALDHVEMDKIYTTNTFLPEMADLSQKGIRFTSRYVIMCSNMAFVTTSKTLKDPTILDRRRDMCFEVHNTMLESLMTSGLGVTAAMQEKCYKPDYSHLSFWQYSPFRGPDLAPVPVSNSEGGIGSELDQDINMMVAELHRIATKRGAEHMEYVKEQMDKFKQAKGNLLQQINVQLDEAKKSVGINAENTAKRMDDFFASVSSTGSTSSDGVFLPGVDLDKNTIDQAGAIALRKVAINNARRDIDLYTRPDQWKALGMEHCKTSQAESAMDGFFLSHWFYNPETAKAECNLINDPADQSQQIFKTLDKTYHNIIDLRLKFGLPRCCMAINEMAHNEWKTYKDLEVLFETSLFFNEKGVYEVKKAPMMNQANYSIERKKPILLIGPPGVGKTSMVRGCSELIDEFANSDDTLKQAVDRVWSAYENPQDYVVLTGNDSSIKRGFERTYKDDPDRYQAFMRRCNVITFSWRRKNIWGSSFSQRDLVNGTPYDKAVKIVVKLDDGRLEEITEVLCRRYLNEGIAQKDKCRYAQPLRTANQVCDLEVIVNIDPVEIADPSFKIGLTDLMARIKVVHGSLTKYVKYMYKVSDMFTRKVGDVDTCLMTLNTLISEPIDGSVGVTFASRDRYILMNNEDDLGEFFRSDQMPRDPEMSDEAYQKILKEQFKEANPIAYTVYACIDALLFMFKTGVAIFSIKMYHDMKTEDNRNARIVKRQVRNMSNEGWAEDMDDMDAYYADKGGYAAYHGLKIPKASKAGIQKDVYCGTHRRVNCPCYKDMDFESRRPILQYYCEDRRMTPVKDTRLYMESGDECRHIFRQKPIPQYVQDESGDECRHIFRQKPQPQYTDIDYLINQCPSSDTIASECSTTPIFHSYTYSHKGSSFRGFCAEVCTKGQVASMLRYIKQDYPEIQSASHVMFAYRLQTEEKPFVCSRDDGETHAGTRLVRVLEKERMLNVLVVIARWYGSQHLGEDRFFYIEEVAKEVLKDMKEHPDYRGNHDCVGKKAEEIDRRYAAVAGFVIQNKKMDKPDYVEAMTSEAMEDPMARDILRVVHENTLMVLTNSGQIASRAIMLKDRIGVANNHSVRDDCIRIDDNGITYNAPVLKRFEKKDIAFFELPKQARSFKNIVRHFITDSGVPVLTGYDAILQTSTKWDNQANALWRVLTLEDVTEVHIEAALRYGINYKGHSLGVEYTPLLTSPGDCGSAIVILNPSMQQKLIGFHSAASRTQGLGCVLTQEFINRAFSSFASEALTVEAIPDIKILPHQEIQREREGTYGGIPLFGKLAKEDGTLNSQFHPTETKFYTSPLAWPEKFGHQFEPAVLDDYDPRKNNCVSVIDEGIQKWNQPQPAELDLDLLRNATMEIADKLADEISCSGLKTTVLTKTEAINGVSYLAGSNPMYRKSSAGYPFKHWKGLKTKSVLFEEKDGLFVIKKDERGTRLNHAIDALVNTARKGERSAVVFCSSLKDEPLKLKKIYDVTKTRTFAACPVDYTIAHRMYFHGAGAAMTTIFHKIPMKVGIDPASLDFHMLYTYHSKVSNVGFDGDFANWDATIPRAFMEMVPLVYNKIYQRNDKDWKPEHDTIRNALHSCIQGPLITYDNYVVRVPGGNPSGQPQTALDNCIINYILTYYCYNKIMKAVKPLESTFEKFDENVRCSFYGDDNMITVKPEILPYFNFKTYKAECEKIGFKLTNAAKDGEEVEFLKLEDMEFLKRNFVMIEGKYYGKLVVPTICKMLSYTTKKKTHKFWKEPQQWGFDKTKMPEVMQGILRESCLHGEDFYNEIREHIRDVWMQIRRPTDPSVAFPSYQSCLVQVLYKAPMLLV